jgi:D-serine deaminase-like pyridoxal phosphate-dependent protein
MAEDLSRSSVAPATTVAAATAAAFRNLPGSPALHEPSGSAGPSDPFDVVGMDVRDLLLPTLALRGSALRHNLEVFARWCEENGVSHAPHGKTTMAPQLFRSQLDAGAWAVTAATVAQTRLMWEHGVRRVLLANQVVDPPGLNWVAKTLAADPGFELFVLVDSLAGVERMDALLGSAGFAGRLDVLLELGASGGRTGVRTMAEADAVAAAVNHAQHLELAGVECFEGIYPPDRAGESVARVDALVASLAELLAAVDGRGAFTDRDEIVISAGGSCYPDRAAIVMAALPPLSRPVRPVVRSGCYLTHDHGRLGGCSPLHAEAGHRLGALEPALELWAYVLSTPERGLALCGFGKRDAPYDVDLPVVLGRAEDDRSRSPVHGARVESLNDQHAFVRHEGDLAVGDLLVLGVSHPCTAFDKWPLVPVLDDHDRVVDTVRTYF